MFVAHLFSPLKRLNHDNFIIFNRWKFLDSTFSLSKRRIKTVAVLEAQLSEYAFVAEKFQHLRTAQYRRDYYEASTGIPCGVDGAYSSVV